MTLNAPSRLFPSVQSIPTNGNDQVEQDELKRKSIDRGECTIDCHIAAYSLGKMQVGSVASKEIDEHVNGLLREGRLSSSSIEKVVDVLNAAYNWAISRQELEFNPVTSVKLSLKKRIQKLRQKAANDADVIVLSPREEQDVGEEALVITTQTGHPQTATNLEHRAAIVFKNAGLEDYSRGLHIFRRTFATRMYESGARTTDIAAYIGDLESTTAQYYIVKRKKYVDSEGKERQIVDLPTRKQ